MTVAVLLAIKGDVARVGVLLARSGVGAGRPSVDGKGGRVQLGFLVLAIGDEAEDAGQHHDQHQPQNATQGRVVRGGGDVPVGLVAVFRVAARSFAVRSADSFSVPPNEP